MLMASETASSVDEEPFSSLQSLPGKHRVVAELKRLDQDSKFLEEELKELEKSENMSAICTDLLQNMESRPDPLLPVIRGPVNMLWDRWFEGPQDPHACGCWIL
ncbi:guanine nucleotide-binding protein subunit gamma 2-like [Gastrolobium bilobum]|uniref:guanine nucleotide-binding protein subunit gamma 2-like n=1 Tax=Gastrolobium bilobum TaxID=150636 RepID=UPI002AB17A17|nr:guanine nucleotide-binding protein subunit gamma 2-like [Gastrolobium bilobum]